MSAPKTLLELAGADLTPSRLDAAVLVLIDLQNEYLSGPLALPGAAPAVDAAAALLAEARVKGAPVVHVAHKGRAGSLFDRDDHRGRFIDAVAPAEGEAIVEKGLPNSFAGTDLADVLSGIGRSEIVIAGFMTHMCVSATVRAGLDHGYRVTVDADATATRDLPDGTGGVVDAATVQRVALAELADRFAIVARGHDWSV